MCHVLQLKLATHVLLEPVSSRISLLAHRGEVSSVLVRVLGSGWREVVFWLKVLTVVVVGEAQIVATS
jgi:hypothetical protein